ncbi:hypothetical protein K466DRAFT_400845 [Polyporus arcularius HHB13444]|uniref:Uncharacterized protein n=1 Tax=Polyporus arcularius HHB13444 TaxID=1314778 RepID=A0A5C3PPM7_9APHY|nr:hypothetical protein K466DRAFT_400845 [Polyporus arcularius HHB13444]
MIRNIRVRIFKVPSPIPVFVGLPWACLLSLCDKLHHLAIIRATASQTPACSSPCTRPHDALPPSRGRGETTDVSMQLCLSVRDSHACSIVARARTY